ncbi:prepilin-type N-terminal cleavage/methylation domain-containing protein [Ereboglobus sp. PH5-5]|uniref:type II secretion system protein n=1 Tax=Ereboglobus sp. PH5-5 TaxID=2940529 RepID=UPI002406E258|nr:type II secretion system protein [Ereboglobus sp. PH5-5]MDF9833688.1 prepilin-type N-terminal cleavage/methylation domain-containing protein [Ereboglobus sp. PH5-5]
MKHNKINSRKGFTLVEMLGVLAIIAILISVISVGVLSAINRARTVATISNFKNLETALLAYIAMPESGGKAPLTKAAAVTSLRAVDGMSNAATVIAATDMTAYTLESVFLSAGTLERLPNWRVGNDGVQSGDIALANIAGWNRKKNGFCETENNNAGTIAPADLADFTAFIRTECAPVDNGATPGECTTSGQAMNSATGVNFQIDGTSNLPSGRVAYIVIPGLTPRDAEKISEEINGTLNIIDLKQANAAGTRTQTAGRFAVDCEDAIVAAQDGTATGYYFLANL